MVGPMGDLVPYLVFVACLGAVVGSFTWLAALMRRRGVAGAAMRAGLAAHDEAFRVTAYDSHYEIQAQAERKSPVLSPGDRWGRGASATPHRKASPGPGTRRPLHRTRRRLSRWTARLKRQG